MTSNIFRIQNNIFELQLLNNEQFPLFMQNYSKKRSKKRSKKPSAYSVPRR